MYGVSGIPRVLNQGSYEAWRWSEPGLFWVRKQAERLGPREEEGGEARLGSGQVLGVGHSLSAGELDSLE